MDKEKAKNNLENAIKAALESGLYYEDLCEIMAKAINEFSK